MAEDNEEPPCKRIKMEERVGDDRHMNSSDEGMDTGFLSSSVRKDGSSEKVAKLASEEKHDPLELEAGGMATTDVSTEGECSAGGAESEVDPATVSRSKENDSVGLCEPENTKVVECCLYLLLLL